MKFRTLCSVFATLACGPLFAADFSLASPGLANGDTLPLEHVASGCGGKNVSPALVWQNAPSGTRSFAVTAYDPDAPTGSGWWHWMIVNLPADTIALPANAGDPATRLAPEGSLQRLPDGNDPVPGYFGACPPKGDKPHRYIFTVLALGTDKISVAPSSTPASTAFQINKNILAKASLTLTFGR